MVAMDVKQKEEPEEDRLARRPDAEAVLRERRELVAREGDDREAVLVGYTTHKEWFK